LCCLVHRRRRGELDSQVKAEVAMPTRIRLLRIPRRVARTRTNPDRREAASRAGCGELARHSRRISDLIPGYLRSLTQFLSSSQQPNWARFSRSCQRDPNSSCFTNAENMNPSQRNYLNRTIHGSMRDTQAYLARKLRKSDLGTI
jgi:hypothetical protein